MSWLRQLWTSSWARSWASSWVFVAGAAPSDEALRFEEITGILPDSLHLGTGLAALAGGMDFTTTDPPAINVLPLGLVADILTGGMYVFQDSTTANLQIPYPFGRRPTGGAFLLVLLFRIHDPLSGTRVILGTRDGDPAPNEGWNDVIFPSGLGDVNEDSGATITAATVGSSHSLGQWNVFGSGIDDTGFLRMCSQKGNSSSATPLATDSGAPFILGEILAAQPMAPIEIGLMATVSTASKLAGVSFSTVAQDLYDALVEEALTPLEMVVTNSQEVVLDNGSEVVFA